MKCQLFFGHKIMIGTVDSYTNSLAHPTLLHNAIKIYFSKTGTLAPNNSPAISV